MLENLLHLKIGPESGEKRSPESGGIIDIPVTSSLAWHTVPQTYRAWNGGSQCCHTEGPLFQQMLWNSLC